MNRKTKFAGAIAVMAASFATAAVFLYVGPGSCLQRGRLGLCEVYSASMVQLVANPNAFHGKRVQVLGYLNLEFEGNALYLHAEDSRQGLYSNSMWLSVPPEWPPTTSQCINRTYVLLEGTFNAHSGGHMGLWAGSIEEVTRCLPLRRAA
jgi:hypothetical protein